MSYVKGVVLGQLEEGHTLIELLTKDLSEREYFRLPVKGANHIAWILGHIACTEDWAVAALTGSSQRVKRITHDLFGSGSTCVAHRSRYPKRSEIDDLFRTARARTAEVLTAFDLVNWDDPSPDAMPNALFPTKGSVWARQATHQYWHIGQMAVCRVAMHKPRVFG
jgi:hypothetical protein